RRGIQGRGAQRAPAESAGAQADAHRGQGPMKTALKYAAGGAALAALGYAAYAGTSWARYGRPAPAKRADEQDPLLDRFMPIYDIVERHHVHVMAPPDVTLAAARDLNIQ